MNIKRLNLIIIPTSIILIIFRFFHLLYGTDCSTGFSKSIVFDVVLYVVLAALFLFIALNFYYGRFSIPTFENKKSKLVSYAVILFAVFCEFMSVLELLERKYLYPTDNTNIMLARIVETTCAVLGVLAGICIVFESVKAMSLSAYKPNILICCIIVLYLITVLFTYYATQYTMVTISQNLLGLFFWLSAPIFAYAYLRYLSDSKTVSSYKLSLIFGYFTAICGLLVTVPRFIFSMFIEIELSPFNTIEQMMILPTAIVVAIITYKLSISTNVKTEQ